MTKIDYVLLAAGNGKRLWPITEHCAKTMVRVLEKPLLEWIVEAIYDNANKIIIVIGAHRDSVIGHFSASKYKDKIIFVEQIEQKGTGHAVLQTEPYVEADKFVVINADTFSDPKIYDLIAQKSADAAFILGKTVADGSKYGVLEEKNGKLIRIVEKPPVAQNVEINTGTYCVPIAFFDYLRNLKLSPRGEYEVTDALTAFAAENTLKVVPFESYWNDVGYFWNLLDVTQYALEHLMKEKKESGASVEKTVVIKGKLHIGKNSNIVGPSRIEGNVYIGENCSIGPHALLKDCALEEKCAIGSSEVKRSVLMKGVKALHFTHITDSIICPEVNFGAGSQVANLRFDKSEVNVEISGNIVASHLKKLGTTIGEKTNIGCNAVIYPGKLVGSNCTIYPNKTVEKNLESNTTCK